MRFPFRILAPALLGWAIATTAAPLEVRIVPVASGAPVTFEGSAFINRSGETWSLTRLSYLVSDLALRDADGAWHPLPCDPAWMNAATDRSIWPIADAPTGKWTGIRFDLGLPPSLNDRDPAAWPPDHALNPNLNGLHWSWQGGYIFLAIEGRFRTGNGDSATGLDSGFVYHLAREPYRTAITLPVDFTLAEGVENRLEIRFDVARLIDGTESLGFARDGSSTHSKDGDPVAIKLQANLPGAFSIASAGETEKAPAPGLAKTLPKNVPPTPDALVIPPSFPRPYLPDDNPLTPARVALGKRLFHETALSRSGSLSCASCHTASAALTDPRRLSVGGEGRVGKRNAMPLFNLAWKPTFFWDGRASALREQVLVPIQDHLELDESLENVVAKLHSTPDYREDFAGAFGAEKISSERLALALEAFLLTLVSHDSKFDRARRGEVTLSELEQHGFELFMTEREPRLGQLGGDCFHCHGGALFTDHQFRNNGLAINPDDPGRATVSGSSLDAGTFATPSLRNVALTAPYMHDGRFATLEEVLDHYSEGVERTATLDPNLAKHPDGGLGLSNEDKAALIAFLRTLTDDQFARDAFEGVKGE